MTKIIGHRGAAGLVAENTLESISKALDCGVDGIEIDVHVCKSGDLVVIHDTTLDRTTNSNGIVANYTLQELQRIRTKEGFVIPTLVQVLDLINAKCILNIELKGLRTALPVVELLEKYVKDTKWKYEHFILSTFDHSQLVQIKQVSSDYRLGVLTEGNGVEVLPMAKNLLAYSIHPSIESLTKEDVDIVKKEDYKVFVWTVNEPNLIKQSKIWKVDGVITDFPSFAK